jgi:hypothetical protein
MLKDFTDYLETLKEQGFKVFIPANPSMFNYAFIVDSAENIGYLQYSNMVGFEFSTVHKPNKQTGTGFSVDSIEQVFIHAPYWAKTYDRESVVKYKSLSEFLKSRNAVPLTQF